VKLYICAGVCCSHAKLCLQLCVFLLQACIVQLELSVDSLEPGVLLQHSLPVLLQLLDHLLHLIRLCFLLVPGCLCCNSVLQFPPHKSFFWREVVQVGSFPYRTIFVLFLDIKR